MEGQRQYYRGYCGEKKMMRNRFDLGYDQSTDLAVVDVIDKLKKSQLANGGYCQQGNSSNAYESVEIYMKKTQQIPGHDQYTCSKYQQMESGSNVKLQYDQEKEMLFVSRMMSHEKLRYENWINELPNKKEFMLSILQEMKKRGVQNIYDEETFIRIIFEKKSEIVGKDKVSYELSKYQQMESGSNVKLEYNEEKEMLFVSRMMSHEKLRYEKWINELPNKKEFMVNILQEMKKRGVQNIYDEETFIRIVFEKKSEIVGKDKVSYDSQQNSVHAVSEYGAAASTTEVINSVDRLSNTELSFVKDMMSCEEIKEFSMNEDFMFEIMREMKKQGIKNLCNKESFIRFVSEKMSKTQGFSNHNSLSITKVSNGYGGFDGYNDQVVACAEFSSSEVSFVRRMMVSERINWARELSSHKDRESFLYNIIRQMKREGIKNICNEEYFIKRIHQEIKRTYQQEKHKQIQRNNGGGCQIVRQEIITTYDDNDYQRVGGYRGNGGYGGAAKMIHADAGECYEDDFQGQGMQQKKIVMGQHKYHQYGGGGGYAYGRYCQ